MYRARAGTYAMELIEHSIALILAVAVALVGALALRLAVPLGGALALRLAVPLAVLLIAAGVALSAKRASRRPRPAWRC